jgi:hypothetical protein
MPMTAPVCPVSRDQQVWMPGARNTAITPATDLASLIQAVNNARQVLQNVIGPGLPFYFNTPQPKLTPPIYADRPNWTETHRDTRQVRVYHSDASGKKDLKMYVDVIRIDKVVFQYLYDDPYGEEFDWVYKRGG